MKQVTPKFFTVALTQIPMQDPKRIWNTNKKVLGLKKARLIARSFVNNPSSICNEQREAVIYVVKVFATYRSKNSKKSTG